MADEDDQSDAAGAERAFEGLRAEVLVMRRAVEALPHEWEDKRPPDYTPNFARIEKAISLFERRLAAVEGQPALQRTPEQYATAIERAGREAVAGAVQRLDQAVRDANNIGNNLTNVIGAVRGRRDQREWLIWIGVAGLWIGFCVGVIAYFPTMDAINYLISAF